MNFGKRFAAGICAVSILLFGGCGGNNKPTADNASIIEFEPSALVRKIPDGYAGEGSVFDLTADKYASSTSVELTPTTLHCSDGVDRQSYAISSEPVYLSEGGKGSDTANGLYSSVSNLTLVSQVGLLDGSSVEQVLDELINRQVANAGENTAYMVSNTLKSAPNLLLTDTLYTEGNSSLETFYVLDLLDKEKVQLYILSRAYEDVELTEDDINAMDTDALMKYCLSADENRDVFCGILQSLLAALAR